MFLPLDLACDCGGTGKPRGSWGWMKKGGPLGNFAFGIQLPCHEEAQAACGQACMGGPKASGWASNFQPALTLPATWMSLLKVNLTAQSWASQLKQNGTKDELLLPNIAHVTDSVNKINDCYCYEPLNLEVVCYTAVDNDTLIPPLLRSAWQYVSKL